MLLTVGALVSSLLTFVLAGPVDIAPPPLFERTFDATADSEAIAVVHASCARCDWGITGREAVALRVVLDDRYSQHLLLTRGDADSDYRVTLGTVRPGRHRVTIERDVALSAEGAGSATVSAVDVALLTQTDRDFLGQSMAPVLHARPNTVRRFTDVPLLMWYEIVPTARGRQFRYSVIFSNEDGGTATDRLMATWGRTTDIEYVYGVELDESGRILGEEFQGPKHEVPAFKGRHENAHPLQWVSTDNNMVSESGPTTIRYAPAPELIDLTDASREVVMDRHRWTYAVTAKEMIREGKISNDAAAGSGRIPDPRRFVFVEACTELENAAIAFSVRATHAGVSTWYDSDRGLPEFRIVRPGCFRGGVPLPAGASVPDAVRFRAYALPVKPDAPPPAPGTARLIRINSIFGVRNDFTPDQTLFHWAGPPQPLLVGGEWVTVPFGGGEIPRLEAAPISFPCRRSTQVNIAAGRAVATRQT